uniref:Secreted protein n=1 Tax=Strongyloides papillosus TaxID=174720 RepID=A0A0N5BDY0_STREA
MIVPRFKLISLLLLIILTTTYGFYTKKLDELPNDTTPDEDDVDITPVRRYAGAFLSNNERIFVSMITI